MPNLLKRICVLSFAVICIISANAQVDNHFLENSRNLDSTRTGSLYLHIYNHNFQRNYEYFNRFADGITYYGLTIQPELEYYSSEHVVVSAGLHYRKDFGQSGFYDKQPVFRINYHKGNFQLINGTLNGSVSHRLIEPLYDYDRIIKNPLEYGTQFILKNRKWDLDAWVNWENMIYKPSPEQERISGGANIGYKLIAKDRLQLELKGQFLAFHQGGQIDTLSVPLTTIVNSALGFKLDYSFNGFIQKVYTENYFATYKDFSFTKLHPFLQGNGILLNAGFKTKFADLVFTYWKGSGFESVHGAPIYESVSSQINNPGFVETHRDLIFFRLISDFKITDQLYIGTRIEPYIDLNNPKFEFSNSLYLVYKEDFFIKKKKNL